MKILLVGEYNRAHKNIKEGLELLGHQAIVVGLRDGFKKVDVDVKLKNYFEKGILKKLRVLFTLLFNFDFHGISMNYQINKHKNKLSNYDVIQFINEAPFLCNRKTQLKIIKKLIKWNNRPFLLSCGTDYLSVKYAFDKKFRYDILTPYFQNKKLQKHFSPALSYLKNDHIELHRYIYSKINGVIANDIDYHIPLVGNPKYLGLIPHAINIDKIKFKPLIKNKKIIVFHGINRNTFFKKGNDIFEKALDIIAKKYSDRVEIVTVENLPYFEYIQAFDNSHIVLDQVYAYDQGYNALEAMAKGKVVFTGAEQEWLDYYNLEEDTVAINAIPDAEAIADKLEWLILNPSKIAEISQNARNFIEKEHNYIECSKKYVKTWTS